MSDNTQDLPVKETDDFIAEFESMNLDKLKDKQFMVAVSNGKRNGPTFICSSMFGPFDFYEMVEQVGCMWRNHQHHAKVIVCSKDPSKPQERLDQNTTDYIEWHYDQIAVEGLLEGVFDGDKKFTCQANIIDTIEGSEEEGADPRKNVKEEDASK